MQYALIMAGGSGTRLWPMSRRGRPKQLIPFLDGRALLHRAWDRLEGLFDPGRILVCALEEHRSVILDALPGLLPGNYLGEPMGRDTLNAVGLGAMVADLRDPEAVMAVVTADQIIEPADRFRRYLEQAVVLVEEVPNALVTFGITPTAPATGFGYLKLGAPVRSGMFRLEEFREKPSEPTAREYFEAGPDRYLWNSGMFVWRARTLLACIQRYEPETYQGLVRIREAWETPERQTVLTEVYPTLRRISVDYAVMEKASRDPAVQVLALPMSLDWMDVGNWRSFAQTVPPDDHGNRIAAKKAVVADAEGNLVASSDPSHIVAVVGCKGLVIVHTPDATLVCAAECAEAVKDLTATIRDRFGTDAL